MLGDRSATADGCYAPGKHPHDAVLPSYVDGVTTVPLFDDCVRLPELASVSVKNTSFLVPDRRPLTVAVGVEGVVICRGGSKAAWSLYVEEGVPTYAYNWLGHELTRATSSEPLPVGRSTGNSVGPYPLNFPFTGTIHAWRSPSSPS